MNYMTNLIVIGRGAVATKPNNQFVLSIKLDTDSEKYHTFECDITDEESAVIRGVLERAVEVGRVTELESTINQGQRLSSRPCKPST